MKHIVVRAIFLILISLSVSGCVAPTIKASPIDQSRMQSEEMQQKTIAHRVYLQRWERANTVAWPIWVEMAPECGKRGPDIGIGWIDYPVVRRGSQSDAMELEALKRAVPLEPGRPTVAFAVKGGPADQAGLKRGDVVRYVNGFSSLDVDFRELLTSQLALGPVSITVSRANGEHVVNAAPAVTCGYPIDVVNDGAINAYADGQRVFLTYGMMRFVESDDELAVVLGHELGHNVQGHIDAKRSNAAVGTIFDIVAAAYGVNTGGAFGSAGGASFSQEFETEADLFGAYAMARAGVAPETAAYFWRRMGAEHSGSIKSAYGESHPGTAQRFLQLDDAAIQLNSISGPLPPMQALFGVIAPAGPSQTFERNPSAPHSQPTYSAEPPNMPAVRRR
jgi:hypothetical protein